MTTSETAVIAEWVVTTCLWFGASVYTAYIVAGLFVQGLEQEWSRGFDG
jgi:hypothetical protein